MFFFFCIKPKQSYQHYETGIDTEACASATRSVHLSVGCDATLQSEMQTDTKATGSVRGKINQSINQKAKKPPKKVLLLGHQIWMALEKIAFLKLNSTLLRRCARFVLRRSLIKKFKIHIFICCVISWVFRFCSVFHGTL